MGMCDLHVHTVFSDGADTPERMAQEALARGMSVLGFADHSFVTYDEWGCLTPETVNEYRSRVRALAKEYRGSLKILCGTEQDYYSPSEAEDFDYVIGSVHAVKVGDRYVAVDDGADRILACAERDFGGDVYAFIEEYYRTEADVVRVTHASVIGHFDLVAKHNERTPFFDETHPRYRAAWQRAADALLAYNVPFEINTGAISRGYRSEAYPLPEVRAYLAEHGGKFILSSDCHRAADLCFGFEELIKEK